MQEPEEYAIMLVSGGMDSIVAAALAMKRYKPAFLHIHYGQKTENREKQCFFNLIRHYQVATYRLFDFQWLGAIKGSTLTDRAREISVLKEHDQEVPSTYVPFRNTLFIAAAVAWAEVISASTIVYGAVEADRTGYPDCRRSYLDSYNQLRLWAPLIDKTKREIVELGHEMNVPFQETWSCYKNSDHACGQCDSCLLRLDAFQATGCVDPIQYQSRT